jgi:anti-sigma regulatory factor (Ser/Thr protein kinase)
LAVSEAVTNAVRHADVGGTVQLQARIADGTLEVVVCDDGVAKQPRAASPGDGLGLAVIEQLTPELTVQSRDPLPGLRLRMTFAIG